MADISITVADVLASGNATTQSGTAGATITAGQTLYKSPTTGLLAPANAASSAPANTFAGIALHASLTGQPIRYATIDPAFVFGGAATAGEVVYLSPNNAGGITGTFGDLSTGNAIIVLGVCNLGGAAGTATINLNPTAGGTHA